MFSTQRLHPSEVWRVGSVAMVKEDWHLCDLMCVTEFGSTQLHTPLGVFQKPCLILCFDHEWVGYRDKWFLLWSLISLFIVDILDSCCAVDPGSTQGVLFWKLTRFTMSFRWKLYSKTLRQIEQKKRRIKTTNTIIVPAYKNILMYSV